MNKLTYGAVLTTTLLSSTTAIAHNGEHTFDFGALHSLLHTVSAALPALFVAASVGAMVWVGFRIYKASETDKGVDNNKRVMNR